MSSADPPKLAKQLEAAIAKRKPFGPADCDDPKQEVPAQVLIDLLLNRKSSGKRQDRLTLRCIHITGDLNLNGMDVELCLELDRCEVDNPISLRETRVTSLELSECELRGGLIADQLEVPWNLLLNQSTVQNGITLRGAKIGGFLSLAGVHLASRPDDDSPLNVALNADSLDVTGAVLCTRLSSSGELRMLGARVGGPLMMNDVTIDGKSADSAGRTDALSLDRAELAEGGFFDGATIVGMVRLPGAKLGGSLSLNGANLSGVQDENGVTGPALSADGVEIAQGILARDGFNATGEVRMIGASIRGDISLSGATLESGKRADEVTAALNLGRARVTGGVICEKLSATGQLKLSGAKIDGSLSLNGASLAGMQDSSGITNPALNGDGVEIAQGLFCRESFSATGEVRLVGATVGGVVSMPSGKLEGRIGLDGSADAFSFDRSEVIGGMFLVGLHSTGPVRLSGATIRGPLVMRGAELRSVPDKDNNVDAAFEGDGLEVSQGMFCETLKSVGEFRLLEARISGQCVLNQATIEAMGNGNDIAVNADGLTTVGGMLLRQLTTKGEVRFLGATIEGQLALTEVKLISGPSSRASISLVGATASELIVAFDQITGVVDFRSLSVGRFWDAENGSFAGRLPDQLRLEGFRYESLREPLDSEQRLQWIKPSQEERHYPRVYAELVDQFRQIGRRGDARRIAIASERRARRDTGRVSFRRLWHDLLFVTVGYGYRNWLALFWVVGLIGAGAVLFALNESSFIANGEDGPPFYPVIYAVDATIPVLDLNQVHSWAATGCMSWAVLFLSVSGYALVAAVVAAAAGLLDRDHA